jgi:nuclear pore complex protein Nup155
MMGKPSKLAACFVLSMDNDSQELASFMDQPDVITHVALVRPKRGMFVDDIKFLLVICTPVSVLLIGVAFSLQQGRKELNLYATDLATSTEVEMSSVIGTEEGRIFMHDVRDGHLYEFHYQEKESWFGKRVHLIDHSRGAVQSVLPRFMTSGSEGA